MSKTITTHNITLETEVSGAAFRDFYKNHWPKEWYVEEFYIDFEDDRGKFILPDDATVKLDDLGWAGWQGKGNPPEDRHTRQIGELYIEAMADRTEEAVISFRLPLDKLEELRKMAAEMGAEEL
jgi:hypothetical protein